MKQDITSVEKIQKKSQNVYLVIETAATLYLKRRRNLNLMTLELRRLHADLVMCYKIVFNIVKSN